MHEIEIRNTGIKKSKVRFGSVGFHYFEEQILDRRRRSE